MLSELDHEFLIHLQTLLNETNDLVQIARDDAARYSATLRDVTADRRYTTQFTLLPGDYVSYDGKNYKLLDISDKSPTDPVKATIRSTDHDGSITKTVRYSTLRPLATPRPELTFTPSACTDVNTGDFVFFKVDNTSDILAGLVSSKTDDTLVVHEYRRAPRIASMYKPIYLNTRNNKYEVKEKPQQYHHPATCDITTAHVVASGTIHNYRVADALLNTMRALGVLHE